MMSDTEMKMTTSFTFTLNQHDMLFVLKALGGRLRPDDEEEARALGNKLTRQRIAALEQTAKMLREAVEAGEKVG